MVVCIFVLALWATTTWGQDDGGVFGFGVEAENVSFSFIEDEGFYDVRTVSTTPAFLVSIKIHPKLFLEPSFGISTASSTVKHEDVDATWFRRSYTNESSFRNINLGIGLLGAFNPEHFVSPYIHGKFNFHVLSTVNEEDGETCYYDDISGTWSCTEYSSKDEVSANALSAALGVGGMVNIKNHVFLTLEGRVLYAYVFDPETKRSGTNITDWKDQTETTASAITTDMVLGLRILF
jgi:hypothetical protein